MGATPSGRWHSWQLRCRIGAMSFVNVASRDGRAWALTRPFVRTPLTRTLNASAAKARSIDQREIARFMARDSFSFREQCRDAVGTGQSCGGARPLLGDD